MAGEAIPIAGRIVAMAHAVDELLGSYETPQRQFFAQQWLREDSGTRFDPALIEALQMLINKGAFPNTDGQS